MSKRVFKWHQRVARHPRKNDYCELRNANSHFMCTVVSVGLGLVSVALTKYINQLPLPPVIVTMLLSHVVIFLLASVPERIPHIVL